MALLLFPPQTRCLISLENVSFFNSRSWFYCFPSHNWFLFVSGQRFLFTPHTRAVHFFSPDDKWYFTHSLTTCFHFSLDKFCHFADKVVYSLTQNTVVFQSTQTTEHCNSPQIRSSFDSFGQNGCPLFLTKQPFISLNSPGNRNQNGSHMD